MGERGILDVGVLSWASPVQRVHFIKYLVTNAAYCLSFLSSTPLDFWVSIFHPLHLGDLLISLSVHQVSRLVCVTGM